MRDPVKIDTIHCSPALIITYCRFALSICLAAHTLNKSEFAKANQCISIARIISTCLYFINQCVNYIRINYNKINERGNDFRAVERIYLRS